MDEGMIRLNPITGLYETVFAADIYEDEIDVDEDDEIEVQSTVEAVPAQGVKHAANSPRVASRRNESNRSNRSR